MEERIRILLEKEVNAAGYILDKVKLEKEGSVLFLRLEIDKEGIIDVEDCVKVTNIVNPILDEADPIEENYMLDVCSKERGV